MSTQEQGSRSVLVAYGTETGNSQDFAEEVSRLTSRLRFATRLCELNAVEAVRAIGGLVIGSLGYLNDSATDSVTKGFSIAICCLYIHPAHHRPGRFPTECTQILALTALEEVAAYIPYGC